MSLAWYRKWRPAKFSDVIGQDHVVRVLRAALKAGSVSHAYIFNGPRGVGKTTMARIVARSVNCAGIMNLEQALIDPCGLCNSCIAFDNNTFVDCLEIDAASNRGIDDIRALRETIHYSPTLGLQKVYIIDEVHMLTKEAFNALLKTLEEPPAHTMFILATTELGKVPDTILSRCQRFDFRSLTPAVLGPHLEMVARHEGIQLDSQGALFLAEMATGSGRDGLSLLQQIAVPNEVITAESIADALGFVSPLVTKDLLKLIREDRDASLLKIFQLIAEGLDCEQLVKDILRLLTYALRGDAYVWSKGLSTEQLLFAAEEWSWALKHCKNQATVSAVIGTALNACSLAWNEEQAFHKESKDVLNIPMRVAEAPVIEQKITTSIGKVSTIEVKTWDPTMSDNNLWVKLKSAVKSLNHSLFTLLQDAELLGVEHGEPSVLTIGVHFPFHKNLLHAIKNRQLLEGALKELTGEQYRIDCNLVVVSHTAKKPTAGSSVLSEDVIDDTELAHAAEELFTKGA